MSHYFRTAAKCDLSMASKAPMSLYNDDERRVDNSALRSTVAADETIAATATISPTTTLHEDADPFKRSRAALDGPSHEAIRLDVKRETNVLSHLARREEQQRLRALEEAALHEKLMAAIQSSRAAESSVLALTPNHDNTSSVAQVNRHDAVAGVRATADEDTKGLPLTATTGEAIPMFERIKLEEARRLRREGLLGPVAQQVDASYGGSIISLYNALTLDTMLKEDTTTPPSVLAVAQQKQFILPKSTEVRNVDAQPESYAAAHATSAARKAQLAGRLHDLHMFEADEESRRAALRGERDADSTTVLRETMEQDHLRREYAESTRLLRIAQRHESSLLGAFDVERRTDPLLPHFPDNVKAALQFSKKPPHPVDVYQAAVRDRM